MDDSDIVIVIFNSKIGQATPRAISGTGEELQRAVDRGKNVHVYFSDAPVSRDALESAKEVEEFKKSLESQGLYGTYSDAADLGFKVRHAIESDLELMNLAAPTGRNVGPKSADPVASYEFNREPTTDTRGRQKYATKNSRLEITNHGEVTAENFTITLEPLDERSLPMIERLDTPATIPPKGNFSYPLMRFGGSADVLRADMSWEENGEQKTKTQTVSL